MLGMALIQYQVIAITGSLEMECSTEFISRMEKHLIKTNMLERLIMKMI